MSEITLLIFISGSSSYRWNTAGTDVAFSLFVCDLEGVLINFETEAVRRLSN